MHWMYDIVNSGSAKHNRVRGYNLKALDVLHRVIVHRMYYFVVVHQMLQ